MAHGDRAWNDTAAYRVTHAEAGSGIVAALSPDFYIDADSVRSAVLSQRLFNLMHLATSIKVDLIVIAASMYDTARAIVLSSLPPGLSRREMRLAFAKRFYEGELPEAAFIAYAEWDGEGGTP